MVKGWKLPSSKDIASSKPPPKKAAALAYDPRTSHAPRVVASGQGFIAERILEIAKASGVTIRKDADLMTLLSVVEVNNTIPVEAFAAVAEILSYIYQTTGRRPPGITPSSEGGTS